MPTFENFDCLSHLPIPKWFSYWYEQKKAWLFFISLPFSIQSWKFRSLKKTKTNKKTLHLKYHSTKYQEEWVERFSFTNDRGFYRNTHLPLVPLWTLGHTTQEIQGITDNGASPTVSLCPNFCQNWGLGVREEDIMTANSISMMAERN